MEAAKLALLEDDLESASNYLAEAKEKGFSLESPLLNTNLDRTEALIKLSRGGPENLERAGVLLKGALATLESHGLICRAQLVRNDLKKLAEKLEQAPATTAKGKLKVVPKR
ncbi:MAG: hypothetical protein VCA74_02340 [Deltaproteobacteria bacterium]